MSAAFSTWSAPTGQGKASEELLVSYDRGRDFRVLILPALFDEANKLRRFTLQLMGHLDAAGVDSFLPDWPGCNESLVPLDTQTLADWQTCASAAFTATNATHFLSIRAGALLAAQDMQGWTYAPQTGSKLLRGMVRARILASKEAGLEESSAALMDQGRKDGLMLAGWLLGAAMFAELERAEPAASDTHNPIAQKQLGGGGLWLRAEPGEDDAQAAALAAIVSGKEEGAQ